MKKPQTEILALNLDRIHESPSNPRKRFGDLEQLAESIKAHGVLQPILVRDHPTKFGHFELVAGARRFRASKLAGADAILAVVKQLDDAAVLETQVIENNQRSDVHPLEEADGFLALQTTHKYSVETIAAKLGRSPTYVYQRLKLTELCDAGRKALFEDKLTPAAALILARIPSAKLQLDALKSLLDHRHHENREDPVGPAEARALVRDKYTLRLADAPFDTKDAQLVAKAGACGSCPKRTGAQSELFADFGKEDLCTDTTCFNSKRDAGWKLRAAAAKAAGQKVLTDAEAKKVFPFAHDQVDYGCSYVALDQTNYDYGKKWSSVLGKECPPIVLARDPLGNVRELVDKKAAAAIAAKKKKAKAKEEPVSAEDEKWRKQEAAERKKRELEQAVGETALATVVSVVEAKGLPLEGWRYLARMVMNDYSADAIAKRRGLVTDKKLVDDEAVTDLVTIADLNALVGIVVENVVNSMATSYDAGDREMFAKFAEVMGVDTKKIASEIAAAEKAKAKKGKAAA